MTCPTCNGSGYEPIPNEPGFDVDMECLDCGGSGEVEDAEIALYFRYIDYDDGMMHRNYGTRPASRAQMVEAGRLAQLAIAAGADPNEAPAG